MEQERLLKVVRETISWWLKFGPVDDGSCVGANFEESLEQLQLAGLDCGMRPLRQKRKPSPGRFVPCGQKPGPKEVME